MARLLSETLSLVCCGVKRTESLASCDTEVIVSLLNGWRLSRSNVDKPEEAETLSVWFNLFVR